jgi:hypothetical protein
MYDLQGNRVAVPLAEVLRRGEHLVTVNCRELPSGFYRLQLETDRSSNGKWIAIVR